MEQNEYKKEPIIVAGSCQIAFTITVCLLQAKHTVLLVTDNTAFAMQSIHQHLSDFGEVMPFPSTRRLRVINDITSSLKHRIAIGITDEDLDCKRKLVAQLEKYLPASSLIAINSESFPISSLQEQANVPERIIGANWTEPAHTTFFLELVINENNNLMQVMELFNLAISSWKKDPYLVTHDVGIRSLMFSAMAREAFYLVENGYATVEDIDRACRNDPGYYLPFAGNCRYIDLMGTDAYGIVMKTLNPNLSKDTELPEFMKTILKNGGKGMENNKGFYDYKAGDAEKWMEICRKFSYEIQEVMSKYPFGYMSGDHTDHQNLEKPV